MAKSEGLLRYHEGQKFREYWTSRSLSTNRHLSDPIGCFLKEHNLPGLQQWVSSKGAETKNELFKLRRGPRHEPIYSVILILLVEYPVREESYMGIAKWLIQNVGVPVDGVDVLGTSALMRAISMKPYLHIDFAELPADAGAQINR